MPESGAVVTVEFPGVQGVKRRPAIIVSSETYHKSRPDVVLALLTSQIGGATSPTDYQLKDWSEAGLRGPSAFRAFFATLPESTVTVIGQLSERDWAEVKSRLRLALATK